MRKAVYDKKGNQVVDTGFKRFDKQTNCISYGNVWANTQYSSYIRPYNEIECNRTEFKVGELMRCDMKHFKQIPSHIRQILEDRNRDESYCLYEFFTYNGDDREVFGYMLHDRDRRYITSSVVVYGNQNSFKRSQALDYIRDLICVDGKMEIPSEVIKHFENMSSLTFVDYFDCNGKEYRLSAYKRVDSYTDNVRLDKKPKISIYEDGQLLDIVNVELNNYPPFVLDYNKYRGRW